MLQNRLSCEPLRSNPIRSFPGRTQPNARTFAPKHDKTIADQINLQPSKECHTFPAPEKLAYRVPEACAVIGFKRSKLYEVIKAGRIRVKKDGNCTVILRTELERYLNGL